MGYFANSTEGMYFDAQCECCKYGKAPCPIALAQITYNYDAVNNEIATKILNILVNDDGTCNMFKAFYDDFKYIDNEQPELFEET